MTQTNVRRVNVLCGVLVFVGVLLILHSPAVLAQAPLFLPVVTDDPGGYQASSVAVADVNGDGKPDLIVTNCGACYGPPEIGNGGSVGVLLGNGDGTFQPAVTYDSGGAVPVFVAVADVNGDGKPDLVVVNRNSNNIGVLLGNGDGTFQPARTYAAGGLTGPESLAVADVNGDGKLDLLVANPCIDDPCDGAVGVLLGNGDGSFQAVVRYSTGGFGAPAVAVADVNGDGKPDVLAATSGFECGRIECHAFGAVGVLLGNGDASFQPGVIYPSGGVFNEPHSSQLAVADVNGDGRPDIIVENSQCCNSAKGAFGVLMGNGDGTFQPVVVYRSAGGYGTSVAVADVDGDGRLDIVVSDQCVAANCKHKGLVEILLGNGDGTFKTAQTYSSGGFLTNSVAIADVNGDGKPDLVVANLCADDTIHCQRSSVGVLLNNTPFCMTPPVVTLSATPTSLWPPNGKMVPVTVSGTITDTSTVCTVKTAAYAVTDEYGEVQPSGPLTLGPKGAYSFTVLLQASRLGTDLDGRLYTITVSASNNDGKTGSQSGTVIVPHDQGD